MKKLDTFFAYVSAVILLQTLFFKFTSAPESVWIFKTLGVEPWGRYFSGVIELISAILLLISSTRIWGAFLGLGTMLGALLSHILFLGIVVQNDGGLLFALCLISLFSCIFITYIHRKEISLKAFGFGLILLTPIIGHGKVSYNTESDFGIHGHDPVSYLTQNAAHEGKKNLMYTFDGVTYLFENELNLETFKKGPEKYIPAYGGWCAYAMAEGDKVDIDPKTFKIIDGKTYLFYNGIWGNTLSKWQKDEKKLKKNADAFWGKLIK